MDAFEDYYDDDDDSANATAALAATILRHVMVSQSGGLRVATLVDESASYAERAAVLELAGCVVGCSATGVADVVVATAACVDVSRVRRGGSLAVLGETQAPTGWKTVANVDSWTVYGRRVVAADPEGCAPWGPPSEAEHDRVEGCCCRATSAGQAARILRERGLVVFPELVADGLDALAHEALANFERCREALASKGIDLARPHQSRSEPASYRELAPREDCRCDVRLPLGSSHVLRSAVDAAEGVARLASRAPASPLRGGNYGRWNWDGSGPFADPAPLAVSPWAVVISLPGAAEQALHADVPHVVDHVQLPGQAFNLFLAVDEDPLAGQTAFVVGSHDLATCAEITRDDADRTAKILPRLVRPRLKPGDALLFDARILHFGLPNRSVACRRPIVYANIHASWFQDRKNWDDKRSVFDHGPGEEPKE